MDRMKIINKLLHQGNGLFFASTASQAGLQRCQLSVLVNSGLLDRPSRGVYTESGGIEDELFSLQQRAKKLVYSHETALFLQGLSDRTPFRYSITVPASYKPSTHLKKICKIYYIKSELADLGKIILPSGMGHDVVVYNRERTLCDIIRSRNKIDSQIVPPALKGYVSRQDKNLNLLYEYAKQFKVFRMLHHYLEVLL